jgi:hypothetical protein
MNYLEPYEFIKEKTKKGGQDYVHFVILPFGQKHYTCWIQILTFNSNTFIEIQICMFHSNFIQLDSNSVEERWDANWRESIENLLMTMVFFLKRMKRHFSIALYWGINKTYSNLKLSSKKMTYES